MHFLRMTITTNHTESTSKWFKSVTNCFSPFFSSWNLIYVVWVTLEFYPKYIYNCKCTVTLVKKANMQILVFENEFSWILLCALTKSKIQLDISILKTYFIIKTWKSDVKILSLKTHLNTEYLLEPAQRMPTFHAQR